MLIPIVTARRAAACSALAAILLSPAIAGAEIASALLREDDELIPGETISGLNNTAVNHVGGYACSMTTMGTATASRIWGHASGGAGTLLRSEGVIGNLEQTSFESFYGMGDGGGLAYSAISNDLDSGETGLDGAWLDDTVVLNELDAVPSLAGQFSTFNSRVGVSGVGTPDFLALLANWGPCP